ncbi:condensation domain-containing protein, partial [Dactylosporangium siamense]|uniref:condensation domain-containing protein n=1 Tax=Dactylosporangium siamense TaxID=685454 RepID=UPI001EF3B4FD
MHQLAPASLDYTIAMPIDLSIELDVDALRAALGALVERHEVLRTRLVAGADGVPYQVIDPASGVELPVIDLASEADPAAAAARLMTAETNIPIDIEAGPLFRATLYRIAPDRHRLLLLMHHVVTDDWSAEIMQRELGVLYAGEVLPPLPVQYADFAVWQREWLSGAVLDGQLSYWRERLSGAPVLELPTDRPRPAVRSSAGDVVEFEVPAEVVAGLHRVAGAAGATMFMTLLSVYMLALSRYSGQDDIVVGTPIANRNRAETEGLIGFFVNTLALRVDLSGDPAFKELLGRVRQVALEAFRHQDVPFEQLVDELVTERDRSRTPLFQALFNYVDATAQDGDEAQDGSGLALADAVVAKFDLRLVLAEHGGRLMGGVVYATALFDRSTVQRLVGHVLELLAGVAEGGARRLSALPLLSASEQAELVRWNETGMAVPAVGGVHELVGGSDAVAVSAGGVELTYAGLQERSNRLAHVLRAVGVGAESVVGVAVGPGVDAAVLIVAVWKAGGAYVPLDAGLPAARLVDMLGQARVSVVLGSSDLVDELPVGRLRTVVVDDPATEAWMAGMPSDAPAVVVRPDQVAYVMFTSGSTGRPKGVQVTHRGLLAYVTGVMDR